MNFDQSVLRKPGRLMQSVDILGDKAFELPRYCHSGERPVRGIRLCFLKKVLHLKAPIPVFKAAFFKGKKILVLNRLALGPYPSGDRKSGIPDSVEIPAPVKSDDAEAVIL